MVIEHYSNVLSRSQDALAALGEDEQRLKTFTAAHNDAADLDMLEKFLVGRTEAAMFRLARIEYQHALFSTAFAQYRQAHVSLRLFFELSLCCILFSAHEIDIKLWLKDQKDSNWQSIICNESGVFSKHFVGAFFEEMKEHCEQYQTLAKTLYRECSEFVHGNRQSFEGIDSEIAYNPAIFETWADRADTARRIVKFAFICRHLKDATPNVKNEIEHLALENFGDLVAVQSIYEV